MTTGIDAYLTNDGVALKGPTGELASLPADEAVSLAKHILHLVEGKVELEPTYQKELG